MDRKENAAIAAEVSTVILAAPAVFTAIATAQSAQSWAEACFAQHPDAMEQLAVTAELGAVSLGLTYGYFIGRQAVGAWLDRWAAEPPRHNDDRP